MQKFLIKQDFANAENGFTPSVKTVAAVFASAPNLAARKSVLPAKKRMCGASQKRIGSKAFFNFKGFLK